MKGRLPWYNVHGEPIEAYIIGVAGGSGSGKTSVSSKIINDLNVPWVTLISMDNFYKSLTPEQIARAKKGEYNFDHPDCFDYDLMFECLVNLKKGNKVEVPMYDFVTHTRLKDQTRPIYGANVIVFEGLFTLYEPKIRELLDLKLYVDTDADIRLARRLKRDIAERGRDITDVLQQYTTYVKPAYDDFIHPTRKYSDVIIPRGLDNVSAISLITEHILRQIKERGMISHRHQLANLGKQQSESNILPEQVQLVAQSNQVKGIHTIIRDQSTTHHDFIFYCDRLCRILIERSLQELPYKKISLVTPTGSEIGGFQLEGRVCGVSIVRSGEAMEKALRSIINDLPLGKILIQTDKSTGQPTLHYCKLPSKMKHVLLCDATICTGSTAMMAIRVLLEHHVLEEDIIFSTLIATPEGLHAISNAFPRVNVITTQIDQGGWNSQYHILPGIGNFGNRYFGTVV